ncbi:Putative 115 kDa protein in type-1 retrotransposable element R1DM [Eumeta japonica]|uniref:115 kDa protein in type-1 retrotransposable element R1DM n=1 Tax=Eumeta variegata TaxID=151549 RepID=A0A4C1ZW05_EUMVA|nr:Putative 115 kDa protein in type-1 retrotransposable element R1DM [Eumeta japonica]
MTRRLRRITLFAASHLAVYPKSIRIYSNRIGCTSPHLFRVRWDNQVPNTAPGADGLSTRIKQNAWYSASAEITEMYAGCVRDGIFPDVWKSGRLLVLLKGNGRPLIDPKAYRPITLLPVLGKILERIILKCSLEIMRGILENQHGFSPGKSTLTALLEMLKVVK